MAENEEEGTNKGGIKEVQTKNLRTEALAEGGK